MATTRRDVVIGMTAATTSLFGYSPVFPSEGPDLLFAGTSLAKNPLASHFKRVDMTLPDTTVETSTHKTKLSSLGGKARLIALWAEWCVPCMIEIRDFAALRPQVATDRFDITLLLTASFAKLDYPQAVNKLRSLGAASLPLIVEPSGGVRAADYLGSPSHSRSGPPSKSLGFSLPCTLLVDAHGRVKGRAFGSPALGQVSSPAAKNGEKKMATAARPPASLKPHVLSEDEKSALLINGRTAWSSPAGLEFLKALGDGLLDRV